MLITMESPPSCSVRDTARSILYIILELPVKSCVVKKIAMNYSLAPHTSITRVSRRNRLRNLLGTSLQNWERIYHIHKHVG